MKVERRFFNCELRKGADSERTIVGYGAVFNKLSDNLGGFRELIKPGAFDGRLQDDVRALLNHDPNFVLARTKSGTLDLSVDQEGLRYEFGAPDTQAGRDLVVSMDRGDIDQSSFAFYVDEDSWDEDDDGRIVRTILKFKRLFDVSPVTFPAYPDAPASVRGLEPAVEGYNNYLSSKDTAEGERVRSELQSRKNDLLARGIAIR